MAAKHLVHIIYIICFLLTQCDSSVVSKELDNCPTTLTLNMLSDLAKNIAPDIEGKMKGEVGTIAIIGGSEQFTSGPYFAAMSALKSGADLLYVFTPESAAPTVKSFSPDFAVYPYLNSKDITKITARLPKMHVVLIGPGLGRDEETYKLIETIIKVCKALSKPLILDANALVVISRNPSLVKDYPGPGVIMTPNRLEANLLRNAVKNSSWGRNVSILMKGKSDQFFSSDFLYHWTLTEGGSGRRTACQGDILSGSLATTYGWAIRYNNYSNCYDHDRIAQSVATLGSARLTRLANSRAFETYGRSMLASNMLEEIHKVFPDVF